MGLGLRACLWHSTVIQISVVGAPLGASDLAGPVAPKGAPTANLVTIP